MCEAMWILAINASMQKLWTRDVYIKWLSELAKQNIIPEYPSLQKEPALTVL